MNLVAWVSLSESDPYAVHMRLSFWKHKAEWQALNYGVITKGSLKSLLAGCQLSPWTLHLIATLLQSQQRELMSFAPPDGSLCAVFRFQQTSPGHSPPHWWLLGCSSCLPIPSCILPMPQLCLCLFLPSVWSNPFIFKSQQLPQCARKKGLSDQRLGFSPVASTSGRVEGLVEIRSL